MIRILANDGIDPKGQQQLEAAGYEVVTETVAQDNLKDVLQNYDAILVRSATKVRQDLIDACPNLKLIGRGGVGMDNIDVEYAKSKGIEVINTPAASSTSVAELVFAHMLNMSRGVAMTNRLMPAEGDTRFKELKKACSKGVELKGKTLGIFGFGRIGQEAARMAIGVGMNVVFHDPFVTEASIDLDLHPGLNAGPVKVSLTSSDKETVLKTSDYLTFHLPFKAGSPAIIGEVEIAQLKDGVGLVNTARGGVIDEQALAKALDSGKVAYAGLDVFEKEPPVNMAILQYSNVSLSPHIGGSTVEAQGRIGTELADKIMAFFG